jgi:hypothetical protein
MAPKKPQSPLEPALPFDVTQEIDPALVEELERDRSIEPTLTPADFEDVTLVLPQKPRRR